MVKAMQQKTLLGYHHGFCIEKGLKRSRTRGKEADLIVVTKHGPEKKETDNSNEHTEKWTRDFRSQNDEGTGRNGGRRGQRERNGG